MKTITQKEFDEILTNHQHYLNKDCDSWENMCAKFENVSLEKVILKEVNLIEAHIYETNFRLSRLVYANLDAANIEYCNFKLANLNDVSLYSTKFELPNLHRTSLINAKGPLLEYRKGKILTEPITGYKICRNDIIVTLKIPAGAIVFSINGDKCRTNKCKVIAIEGANEAISKHENNFTYKVGDEIVIDDFNLEYNVECGEGIHFFMTKEEAINYSGGTRYIVNQNTN